MTENTNEFTKRNGSKDCKKLLEANFERVASYRVLLTPEPQKVFDVGRNGINLTAKVKAGYSGAHVDVLAKNVYDALMGLAKDGVGCEGTFDNMIVFEFVRE